MSRYQPPRRESIEGHLRVARARVKLSGSGWTDKLASSPWVEDLIREGIISGPHRVRKTEGRGLGQRFAARDYRALLRIIDLKSQGINRRSAWVAHLWLSGRDYPIASVRAAFRAEIRKIARTALLDFAPRERLRTQPFGKRYDRRVRQRREDSIFPELVDIIEPFAALGISKRFLPQIGTNPDDVARLISEITGSSADHLSPAIAEMISSLKEGRLPSSESQREIQTLLETAARDQGIEVILQSQEFAEAAAQAPVNVEGTLGTFSVTEQSTLLRTIDAATERQWEITRGMFMVVCSGQLEHNFSDAIAQVAPKHQQALQLTANATRWQRKLARGTPWVRLHLFVQYLHDLVQRKKRPAPQASSPENPEK